MPTIEVSAGEVFDRQAILCLKKLYLDDFKLDSELESVDKAAESLFETISSDAEVNTVTNLRSNLNRINAALWRLEDEIRKGHRDGDVSRVFKLSREIADLNSKRAKVKGELSKIFGSAEDTKTY